MTARPGRVIFPVKSKSPNLTSASLHSPYCSHRTRRPARLSGVDITAVRSLVLGGGVSLSSVPTIMKDPSQHYQHLSSTAEHETKGKRQKKIGALRHANNQSHHGKHVNRQLICSDSSGRGINQYFHEAERKIPPVMLAAAAARAFGSRRTSYSGSV